MMWQGGAMIPDQLLTWHFVEIPVLTRALRINSSPQAGCGQQVTEKKTSFSEMSLLYFQSKFKIPDGIAILNALSPAAALRHSFTSWPGCQMSGQCGPIRGQCGHWQPMRGRGERPISRCRSRMRDCYSWSMSLMSVWPPIIMDGGPGSELVLMTILWH